MDTASIEYKIAFEHYIRKGIFPDLSTKQSRTSTHYIWHTRKDIKVRAGHAANDGKIFAWDNAPPTGHPGEDYGCRCIAEPYLPGVSEFMEITLSGVSDDGPEWSSLDFVKHYFFGNGEAITLRQTGHMVKVVKAYMSIVDDRLKKQIATAARDSAGDFSRNSPKHPFQYSFGRFYDMTNVVFSLGNTTIGGDFSGTATQRHAALEIIGEFNFTLADKFADPLGADKLFERGIELPGSQIYKINEEWSGSLRALVVLNSSKSRF